MLRSVVRLQLAPQNKTGRFIFGPTHSATCPVPMQGVPTPGTSSWCGLHHRCSQHDIPG